MKPKRLLIIFIIVSVSCAALLCCQTFANLKNKGVKGASEAGAKNMATAVSNTGKAIASAAEDITPEQEYYIGRAVAANILKTYSLWGGRPALTAYLNRICNAIAINSSRPELYNGYHVAILDSKEINAFATSGGHIYLTRGLISAATTEDALAGVIAHELAHIQLQHSIKAIRTSRISHAIMVTGAAVAGVVSGYDMDEMTSIFDESVGEIFGTLVNNGYSQLQEYDADNKALSLLAGAGYNPSGLIDMLKELEKLEKVSTGGLNKTHPSADKRRASAERSMFFVSRVTDTSSHRKARFTAAVK
jgi:predicted Zn-dependent protease